MAWRKMPPDYRKAVAVARAATAGRLPDISKAWHASREAARAMATPTGERYRAALELIREINITNTLVYAKRIREADFAARSEATHRYETATDRVRMVRRQGYRRTAR